eukprot:CAMPEP_0118941946 /NCGR_PEP_ID=MMETSP1169-20130426/35031_1 /TAXON_ID=36882 /ORGANISM="Pyramimonas obovata, Strain CCMP722" /LENGTH=258 /DNA_ID=CAMNT_0006886845 /DNA_START=169 /DNA_END=942 /DNA_ORIENTATION=+
MTANPKVAHDQALAAYLRKNPKKASLYSQNALLGKPLGAKLDPTRPWSQSGLSGTTLANPKTVLQNRLSSYTAQTKLNQASLMQQIQSNVAQQNQQNNLQSQLQMKQQQLDQLKSKMSQVQQLQQKQIRGNPGFAKPDYSYYNTCDGTLDKARDIARAHSDIMSVESFTKTMDGYNSELMVVTVEMGPKTIPAESKLRMFLNFGQHGREIITSDVALRLLELLARGPSACAEQFAYTPEEKRKLEAILMNSIIKVSPM